MDADARKTAVALTGGEGGGGINKKNNQKKAARLLPADVLLIDGLLIVASER